MATVIYAEQAIIPAPFVTLTKEYQAADDGTVVGSVYALVLKGQLVFQKGSPNSLGQFWTGPDYPPDEVLTTDQGLGSLLRKQQALRTLFATQGAVLEIDPPDGSAALTCNPRVRSVEFAEGNWVQTCPYTVTLEADRVAGLGTDDSADVYTTYHVSKASEEWSVETLDEHLKTYRLTRQASAVGKRFYDESGALVQEAWRNAKDFVLGKLVLGLKPDRMNAPGVMGNALQAYNYLRTEQVGELSGTFGVTETWLCYAPADGIAAYEETSVSVRKPLEARTTVSIEGTVTGLEVRDNNTWALLTTRFANAQAKWALVKPNLITRAQAQAGVTLNAVPLNQVNGFNSVAGTITYAYEYDNRRNAATPGALSEMVTVVDENPSDVFASIPVPGRAAGPVLQAMGTIKERRRIVTVEIQMTPATMDAPSVSKPNTTALVLSHQPAGSQVFVDGDPETWTDFNGKYSRSTTFVYQ